jgi:hypothetical protein
LTAKLKIPLYLTSKLDGYRHKTFRELLAEGERYAAGYGTVCRYEVEDVIALRDLLSRHTPKSLVPHTFWPLSCKYDHLVFGPDFNGDRAELHAALGIHSPLEIEVAAKAVEEHDEVKVTIVVETDAVSAVAKQRPE